MTETASATVPAGLASGDGDLDLSVVIPSYNTRDLMEQALRSVVRAAAGLQVEIIVVDNASRDGSVKMVRDRFPEVKLIANERNLGFGAANNLAFRHVRGRYVLLLNSDTIVRPGTLRTMVAFMDAHAEAGAAGCRILNPDGTLQLESRRGFPTPSAAFYKLAGLSRLFPHSRRFAHYHMTYLDPDQISQVDALSGSFMIVRRRVLQEVGGFDEAYFMYGEDLDWCYRMRQAGWGIYYVPDTEIIHFRGESGRAEGLRMQYRKNEAMAIFVHKHMRQRRRFSVWLLHAGIATYSLYSFVGPLARRLALPVVDGLLVLLGVYLGVTLRYHPSLVPLIRALEEVSRGFGVDVHPTQWLTPPAYSQAQWLLVYAAPVAIWLACFVALGLYDRHRYAPGWAVLAVALGFVVVVTTVFFFNDYNFSRLATAAAWAIITFLVAGWRLAARWVTQSTSGRRLGRRRLLVAGTDAAARRFVEGVLRLGGLDCQIVGCTGTADERGQTVAGVPVLGVTEELAALVHMYDVDEIVYTPASIAGVLHHVSAAGGGRRVRQLLLAGDMPDSAGPTSIDALPLVAVSPLRRRA